jgi:hypothetical protein
MDVYCPQPWMEFLASWAIVERSGVSKYSPDIGIDYDHLHYMSNPRIFGCKKARMFFRSVGDETFSKSNINSCP